MIRIRLDKLVCIPVFLAAFSGNTALLALSYISIALHEGAHLGAAMLYGCRVKEISVGCFGMKLDADLGDSLTQRLIIRIAGPIMSFLIFVILQWLPESSLQSKLADINLIICIINLLPVVPLDGGMLILDWATAVWGNIRAGKFVRSISICVGGGYIAVCFLIFLFAEPNVYLLIFAVCMCIVSKKELQRIRRESACIIAGIFREGTAIRYISLPGGCSLMYAAEMISEYCFTVIGVFDRDRFVGELTQRDVLGCIGILSSGACLLEAVTFLKKYNSKADTDRQI